MGWKSDWLYRLVFEQFEIAWSKAQREADGRFGPAPNSFLVTEFSESSSDNLDLSPGSFQPERRIRSWRFDGHDWTPELPAEPVAKPVIQRMFFETAIGRFRISNDRRAVTIDYIFGPRNGRGIVFVVERQGDFGRLKPKPESASWIS